MSIVTVGNSSPWKLYKVWTKENLDELHGLLSFCTLISFFTEFVMQPSLKISDTTSVGGHRSVTFTCISPNSGISIHWLFNNQSLQLTERMTLSPTNCALRIDPVRSEDAGMYQCEVSNGISLKTSLPVWWP